MPQLSDWIVQAVQVGTVLVFAPLVTGVIARLEAIVQMRGEAGRRQVPQHDVCLVPGNGGILSTHSTLVLGAQP